MSKIILVADEFHYYMQGRDRISFPSNIESDRSIEWKMVNGFIHFAHECEGGRLGAPHTPIEAVIEKKIVPAQTSIHETDSGFLVSLINHDIWLPVFFQDSISLEYGMARLIAGKFPDTGSDEYVADKIRNIVPGFSPVSIIINGKRLLIDESVSEVGLGFSYWRGKMKSTPEWDNQKLSGWTDHYGGKIDKGMHRFLCRAPYGIIRDFPDRKKLLAIVKSFGRNAGDYHQIKSSLDEYSKEIKTLDEFKRVSHMFRLAQMLDELDLSKGEMPDKNGFQHLVSQFRSNRKYSVGVQRLSDFTLNRRQEAPSFRAGRNAGSERRFPIG